MSRDIVLQNVVLSYPHLFTPRAVQPGQDPKFGANFILPDNFDWTQVQAAIQEAIAEKFGTNVPQNLNMPWDVVPATDKNGNPNHYAGRYFIKSGAQQDSRPQVVDQNVNPVIDQSLVFAGCIVNAYIQAFAYDKQVNRGVSFGLNAIQIVDNSENVVRLAGGGRDASEVFQAVPGAPAPTAASTPVAPAPAPAPAAPPAAAPAAPVPPGAPGRPWNQ